MADEPVGLHYMDAAATTRMDPRVLEAMTPYFCTHYGNASSLHSFGKEASEGIERGRERMAEAINAVPREIVFTSGGTEADNLAVLGGARRARDRGKGDHVVTTVIEHPAVDKACAQLEKEGFCITRLPVGADGLVRPADLEEAVDDGTALVSVMTVNNEIGVIQSIKELAGIAHAVDALFHTDAVQALGKIPVDVMDWDADLASFSAHKLHGPKGVGALFVKKGTPLTPLVFGGGHEWGLRSSTENVPGIVGMGEAVRLAVEMLPSEMPRLTALRDRIISELTSKVPECHLNGHPTQRVPGNANLRFTYIEGEGIILRLDMEGIAASTGSACSTKSLEPSATLLALGLTHEEAHGSLRLSLDRFTTAEDIDHLLDVTPQAIKVLRQMSPLTPSGLYKD
jgi:cysteine desulfurase